MARQVKNGGKVEQLSEEPVAHRDSSAAPANLFSRLRPKYVAVVVVVVVALVVLGVVLLARRQPAPLSVPVQDTSKLSPAQLDSYETDRRIQQLQGLVQSTQNADQKYAYESELSVLYYDRSKLSDALKLATDVERHTHTAASAGALGDIYLGMGDKPNAVKFYTLARDRSPKPASARERSPYNDYQAKIQAVQS